MHKGKILRQCKVFKICKDLYGKPYILAWQVLLIIHVHLLLFKYMAENVLILRYSFSCC